MSTSGRVVLNNNKCVTNSPLLKQLSYCSIFFLILLLGGCGYGTCQSAEEPFLSSHEGEIIRGIVLRPEEIKRVSGERCTSIIYQANTDGDERCGVHFCNDYLQELKGHFTVDLFNHLISDEKVGDPLDSLSLGDFYSTEELESLKYIQTNFKTHQKDLIGLLNDEAEIGVLALDFKESTMEFDEMLRDSGLSLDEKGGQFQSLYDKMSDSEKDWERMYSELLTKKWKEQHCEAYGSKEHEVTVSLTSGLGACKCIQGCKCLEVAGKKVFNGNSWAQDRALVGMVDGGSELRSPLVFIPGDSCYNNFVIEMMAKQSGIKSRMKPSSFSLEGGNTLANSKFLFVGRDVLQKYVDYTYHKGWKGDKGNWKRALKKIDLDTEVDEINEQTVTEKFESKSGLKVIWVGTKYPRYRYNDVEKPLKYYQPIYHIDLFLTLLKWGGNNLQAKDTLYYMLGIPQEDEAIMVDCSFEDSVLVRKRAAHLKAWIIETADAMDEQLRKLESPVVTKRIEIPLIVKYSCDQQPWIQAYWAYGNGLVECVGSEVNYYMPKYPCKSPCFSYAKELITQEVDNLYSVKGLYEPVAKDGLHCSFLVTERK